MTPGPLTRVDTSTLRVQGALDVAVEAGEPEAVELFGELQSGWSLQPGEPFTQSGWDAAKRRVLSSLRIAGYLDASFSGAVANIDAPDNSAKLFAIADSGPLFRIGPISVSGLERFDEQTVLPVARNWVGLAGDRAGAARNAGTAAEPGPVRKRGGECAGRCREGRCRAGGGGGA